MKTDRLKQLFALLEQSQADSFILYAIATENVAVEDYSAAITWFDKVLEVDPSYLGVFLHKARCLEKIGNEAEAIACLKAGMEIAQKQNDLKTLGELRSELEFLEM